MVTPEFKQIRGRIRTVRKYTVDIRRKEYLDFSGAAMAVGHNFVTPSDLTSPVSFLVFRNSYTERLMGKLKTMSGFSNVAFATSGTEACDAALQMNYGKAYISFEGAYHGLDYITYLVSNGTGIDRKNGIVHLKFPNSEVSEEYAIQENERILKKASRVLDTEGGTVITELVQSDGGINVMGKQFASSLKEMVRDFNLRLIVDEVYTALGRSGEMFLYKSYGLRPNSVCLGKALGAGLPLGAVLYNGDYPLYKNNVVSMQAATMFTARVALKVLSRITEEEVRYVREMGKEIIERLQEIRNERIKEVRGRGFMIGVEFVDSRGKPDPEYSLKMRNRIAKKGVVCTLVGAKNNVLKITPPVTIPRRMLERGVSIIADELKAT